MYIFLRVVLLLEAHVSLTRLAHHFSRHPSPMDTINKQQGGEAIMMTQQNTIIQH